MARGKKHSAATKRKMSLAAQGTKNPFYGKHHSTQTKRKLKSLFAGKKNPMYGKKHSTETKRKISLAAKRRLRRM